MSYYEFMTRIELWESIDCEFEMLDGIWVQSH